MGDAAGRPLSQLQDRMAALLREIEDARAEVEEAKDHLLDLTDERDELEEQIELAERSAETDPAAQDAEEQRWAARRDPRAGGAAAVMPADPVIIVLVGEPVAWARHQGGRSTMPFTPKRQRNNAAAWQIAAGTAMAGREPFDCPVRVYFEATLEIPKSWSRRKREDAARLVIRPGKKPDLSNLAKQFEDACNGIVYRDDALIVEYSVLRKIYGVVPQIVATVQPA